MLKIHSKLNQKCFKFISNIIQIYFLMYIGHEMPSRKTAKRYESIRFRTDKKTQLDGEIDFIKGIREGRKIEEKIWIVKELRVAGTR